MKSIQLIASQFSEKSLPKSEWTHLAHLAVAFAELDSEQEFEKTLDSLRRKIKAYNLSVGTPNSDDSGYHETLTVFWLRVVLAFHSENSPCTSEELYRKFIGTSFALPNLPSLFYSKELLFSRQARHHWVNPDLLPLTEIRNMNRATHQFPPRDKDL